MNFTQLLWPEIKTATLEFPIARRAENLVFSALLLKHSLNVSSYQCLLAAALLFFDTDLKNVLLTKRFLLKNRRAWG